MQSTGKVGSQFECHACMEASPLTWQQSKTEWGRFWNCLSGTGVRAERPVCDVCSITLSSPQQLLQVITHTLTFWKSFTTIAVIGISSSIRGVGFVSGEELCFTCTAPWRQAKRMHLALGKAHAVGSCWCSCLPQLAGDAAAHSSICVYFQNPPLAVPVSIYPSAGALTRVECFLSHILQWLQGSVVCEQVIKNGCA